MSGTPLKGRHCATCGETVFSRHMELCRRTQRVGADPVTGKPAKVIHVLDASVLLDFCGDACWQVKQPQVVAAFGLKATWPTFHLQASCCACGRSVDRTVPHVTLHVYDVEDVSKPWLACMRVLNDREFAVLCATCMPPGIGAGEASTGIADEEATERARAC